MLPDFVNGSFEVLGSGFITLSILKLKHEKVVHGFHWGHLAFFTVWGTWNLYYYPYLGQWWSFIGGIGVMIANTIYLAMIGYYAIQNRR